MSFQTNWNTYVAYKAQVGLGSAATGTGASIIPWAGGGAQAATQAVQSQEVRRDGMTQRGRHGSRRAQGSYPGEMQLANYDSIIEAVMRGTWGANATTISNATTGFTSATLAVAGSVVTLDSLASGASLLTVAGGPKVHDVLVWESGVAEADRDRPLRVTGVTADTITFAESLTTVAGPEGTWSFKNSKKLINPSADNLVKRYFTIEEAELDIDGSELFADCMWGRIEFAMSPNGMFTITPSWTGTGAMEVKSAADAPYFTTPSDPAAAVPIAAIDAAVRFNGGDVVDLSQFSLSVGIGLSTFESVSSNTNQATAPVASVSPDVFDSPMAVSMSLTMLRQDLTTTAAALSESDLSTTILLRPKGSTSDWFSIAVPYHTIPTPEKSAASRQGGGRTQTINVPAELIGIDPRGGAYDATMIKFQRSNT